MSAYKRALPFHLLDIPNFFEQDKVGLPEEEKGYCWQYLVYSFNYQVFYKAEIATANVLHIVITVTTYSKPKHNVVYVWYSLISVAVYFKLNWETV